MMRYIKAQSIIAASLLALALGNAVRAQEPSETDGERVNALEEIFVTARRKEEHLQDVPITVTVVEAHALENRKIRNLFDLDKAVPGMTVCCNEATVNFGQGLTFLRGVRGVVTYLGDVPVLQNSGATYFDADNVQVLKGPQGTLFGLSTNGGAIVVSPRKPTDEFEGYAEVGLGGYGRREMTAVLNIPVVEDKLLVRLAATVQKRDGYIYSVAEDRHLNDEDFSILRMIATFRPTDNFENELLVNYYHNDSKPVWFVDVLPGRPSNLRPGSLIDAIYGDYARDYFAQQAALGAYAIPYSGFDDVTKGPFSKQKQLNINNVTKWNLNDQITLKNIIGYQSFKDHTYFNLLGFPILLMPVDVLPNGTVVGPQKTGPAVQYSEELQLFGQFLDDRLSVTIGTFNQWTKENKGPHPIVYTQTFGAITGANGMYPTNGIYKTDTHAIYAQSTYNLSGPEEGLSLTFGYRYSWDDLHQSSENYSDTGDLVSVFDRKADFKKPSWTAQAQYYLNPSSMVFFNYSKGYSRGGFNKIPGLPPEFIAFSPETLDNFEGGIKSQFSVGGAPVRTNLAAYYGKNDDIQLAVPQTFIDPDTGAQKFYSITQNAARGHIYGLEGDFTVLPTESLSLSLAFAYSKAKFDDFVSGGEDVSDSKFILLPEIKYTVNATYGLPIPDSWGELSVSAAYTYQSHTPVQLTVDPAPEDTIPSFDTLDLALTWEHAFGMPNLSLVGFLNNVTKTKYSSGFTPGWDSLGFSGITPQLPRMGGVRVRYDF